MFPKRNKRKQTRSFKKPHKKGAVTERRVSKCKEYNERKVKDRERKLEVNCTHVHYKDKSVKTRVE